MLKKVSDGDQQLAHTEARTPPPRSRKRLLLMVVGIALVGAGAWFGYGWWTEGRFMVETDDAYVSADMAVMTARLTGYVQSVPVAENQAVKAGDPLVEIDPGDARLDLDAATARIATQDAVIARVTAQRDAAQQSVAEAEAARESLDAALAEASRAYARAEDLARTGTGARAALESALHARQQAEAAVRGGLATIDSAKANVLVLEAQMAEGQRSLAELRIARDVAQRNLSFTTVRAPYDGVVGNLSVQPGDLVSPSRRLASVVPLDKVFIAANFKETQLDRIAVGARATVEVDALPGMTLTGRVESFSPASGSVFSLLPADNATGNFTKIVQRLPVRIALDDPASAAGRLRPGLSTTVTVDSRTAPPPAGAD